ncbi:MAG: zinc-binding dehydrogenase [Bacillus sp. (in: Bacteria)]|nr:zinc-binding dehydrogenase [Bacillus sp. (in: firmicutes)]
MKAVVIHETGGIDALSFEEVQRPEISGQEVLIRLNNSALNRRDIFVRKGQYPGVRFPAIPGSDGAGVIEAVGEDVKNYKVSQEVIINPAINWGSNPRFYNKDFSILGVPTDGTHAEFVKVPKENVYPKPNFLSWEEAAALPLAGLTAYRALFTRGNLQKGETVVIPGIGGGVATFLLQMAVASEAEVFVTSSDDKKIDQAVKMGAKAGINYKNRDWPKQLKKLTGGVDISIDTIGGETFSELINLAKPGSRIVTFGATAGPVPNLIMPLIFLKQLDILGTTMGTPEEFQQMLAFIDNHKITPIIDSTFRLRDIQEAHAHMEHGNLFGKIVLNIKG